MPHLDEPEIYYGSLAWPDSQVYLTGSPDPSRLAIFSEATWYDTSIDEHRGAFAMVQSGSELEELVGEFVRIRYRNRFAYLYVIGGASLPSPFGMTRRAWMELTLAWHSEIRVRIDVLQNVAVPA